MTPKAAKIAPVISPPDLYTVLCSGDRTLVVDVRNKSDYTQERIWSSVHLNLQQYPNIAAIARELFALRHATQANGPVTPPTHSRLIINRALYHIVVVDEDGSDPHGVVSQLQSPGSTKPVQLLVGGYKMFSTLYPALCAGSSGQDQYLMEKCEKESSKHTPVEVLPYLFFGDSSTATNFMANDVLGIGSMVNAAAHVDNFEPTVYKYLRCDQEDLPFGDLVPLFNKVFTFIEKAKNEGEKVLVYSAKNEDGRAGMFICAYLMRLNDWPLEKVFLHFKSKSRSFSPNVAILARLGEYETSLSGTKYLEESIKEGEEGRPPMARKEKDRLSEELKYVRRQQAHHLEDERALEAQDDGEEEDLC